MQKFIIIPTIALSFLPSLAMHNSNVKEAIKMLGDVQKKLVEHSNSCSIISNENNQLKTTNEDLCLKNKNLESSIEEKNNKIELLTKTIRDLKQDKFNLVKQLDTQHNIYEQLSKDFNDLEKEQNKIKYHDVLKNLIDLLSNFGTKIIKYNPTQHTNISCWYVIVTYDNKPVLAQVNLTKDYAKIQTNDAKIKFALSKDMITHVVFFKKINRE